MTINKIKSFLAKQVVDFKNFWVINDEPLIAGQVYQIRSKEGNPFNRDGIYIIESKKGWVKYMFIWKDGLYGFGTAHSDKNREMNMLYSLSELEYDYDKKKYIDN